MYALWHYLAFERYIIFTHNHKISHSRHGRRKRGQEEPFPHWIFIHDTANVFFKKHSLCENIPTFTNHLSSLLRWLTLRGRGYWSFFARNGLKFFEKLGIFSKMVVSPKKNSIHFLREAFDVILEVSFGCMPSALPNPSLTK